MSKKKLLISFSGGRTSAYMTWWLLNKWSDIGLYDVVVVFANTGKEVEGTLFFIDEFSQEFNIPIIWIEAKCIDDDGIPYSFKGWKVNHKVVTYEDCSRNGEPFEEMISILGIPSTEAPFCSYQLKRKAIESYCNSIGWKDYITAIGIRFDEPLRINDNYKENNVIYPLAHINPTTKRQVKEWWDKQSFDLNIHPDDGNCDGCWKKGFPQLVRIMERKPKTFHWWQNMVDKYGDYNPRNVDLNPPFNFYRQNKGVEDIRMMMELSQAELKQLSMFDVNYGCSESCEVF